MTRAVLAPVVVVIGFVAAGCSASSSSASGGDSGAADAATCSSPRAICAGVCVDELTDVANCGGCGVVCGETCTGGRCLVTLASGLGAVGPIAVDTTSVYWSVPSVVIGPLSSSQGSIMKVPIDGGTAATLVSGRQDVGSALAVDGTHLFWGEGSGGVMQIPVQGGTPAAFPAGPFTYSNSLLVTDFAVGPAGLVVTNDNGIVVELPFDGGAPENLALVSSQPLQVALNGTQVFWSNCPVAGCPLGSSSGAASAGGPVLGVSLHGGTVSTLVASLVPGAIAADSNHLYVASGQGTAQTLSMVPLDGGAPVLVAAARPSALVTDETSVYWFDGDSLLRMPAGGGTIVTLVSGQPSLADAVGSPTIAVDATSVYWTAYTSATSSPSGVVMKLTPK